MIYGRVGGGQSAECVHGGGTLVWTLIQDYAFMHLTPMTISIPLQNALSQQNIRINVPSTFTVGISTEPGIMNNSAERLLNLPQQEIEEIRKNVSPELNKIGLYLINVNITDITDSSDYIESIGKKADSGRRVYVQQQEAMAIAGENTAKADIADSEALLSIKKAEAYKRGEVAKREAVEEIQKAQYRAEQERLKAEDVVQKEIEKQKIEIAAEAEAEKTRREAKGQADAILLKYEAEARGIRQVLDSKAAGYAELVKSCAGDAKSAGTFLMIEKLQDLVALQIEAIKNLKIDKITVWDTGNNGSQGTTTANFLSGFIKSLHPLHEIAEMAELDLPKYLGDMKEKEATSSEHAAPATKRI